MTIILDGATILHHIHNGDKWLHACDNTYKTFHYKVNLLSINSKELTCFQEKNS
jgi:hypothetical protein